MHQYSSVVAFAYLSTQCYAPVLVEQLTTQADDSLKKGYEFSFKHEQNCYLNTHIYSKQPSRSVLVSWRPLLY